MSDLLEEALNAHGGLARWNEVTEIRARATATGLVFSSKGYEGKLQNLGVIVKTREQWTALEPLLEQRAICTPNKTVIESSDHQVLKSRDDPRSAFEGHTGDSPWDILHLAYFLGYANWNYFNEPFTLTLPGFKVQEVEPWEENGETWRRLRVEFPDYIAAHNREQFFYFNSNGILVRKDYSPSVRGNMPAAHYLLDHENVEGLILPRRRRIYRRGSDGQRIPEPLLIGVDYADYRVS
jgi:hypothetical protein